MLLLLAAAAHGWRLSRPRAPLLNLRIKRPRSELPPAPPSLFTVEDARPRPARLSASVHLLDARRPSALRVNV